MTTPVAGFAVATIINTPVYWYLQISGTAQGVAISQALEDAVAAGVIANGTSVINKLGWQISITDLSNNTSFATQGDYIVLTSNSSGTITGINLYNGPDGTYSNPPFASLFTIATA
jgi:hypothetical protein